METMQIISLSELFAVLGPHRSITFSSDNVKITPLSQVSAVHCTLYTIGGLALICCFPSAKVCSCVTNNFYRIKGSYKLKISLAV